MVHDGLVVLQGIEYVRTHDSEVGLQACVLSHLQHRIVDHLNGVRGLIGPLLDGTTISGNVPTPNALLEELSGEVTLALQQHLLGQPLSGVTVDVQRLVVVDLLLLGDIVVVGVLTAVVRICYLDVPVATCGLSTAATLLDLVTEHISLAILEVHVGLLVHVDDGEHLVGDESVSTLHVGGGDVCQRAVNVTQISHLRHLVSLLPTD